MAFVPALHRTAVVVSKMVAKQTQTRALNTTATRSLQQAMRYPLTSDEQEILAGAPWPLTMLTEEENMFKDSGACLY